MDSLNLPRTKDGWASAAIADLKPAPELNVLGLGEKSLVIGWGMPPSVLQYIRSCGASFIDVEVHSLRFSRHLHLGVRTNNRKIATVFSRVKVPNETFQSAVIGMKALFSRRGDSAMFCRDSRVGVFLGQTEVDLALVCNGQLVRPMDVIEKVACLAATVDVLAIKPHPYQENTAQLDDLFRRIPNAVEVDCNIYAMLCAENVDFFAGISSGALIEAEYFGRRKERIIEQDRNNAAYLPVDCSDWIPVGSEIASLPVMRDAVSRSCVPFFLMPRRRYAAVISTANSGLIDQAFGVRWGLQLDAAGVRSTPRVALGGDVRFGSDSAYAPGLTSGWHEPETWGVWSSGGKASFLLMLDTAELHAVERVRITVIGALYQPKGSPSVELEVRINGETCQPIKIDESLMFFRDFEACQLHAKSFLMAEFLVKGAHRPCDLSPSTDARCLGFGLHLLRADALNSGEDEAASVDSREPVDDLQMAIAAH